MIINTDKNKLLTALLLVLIAVVGRFLLIEYVGIPNFEIVTAISLVAGIYLGGIYAFFVPVAALFLSDMAIGNNQVFIFTWSAFLIIGLLGVAYKRFRGVKEIGSARIIADSVAVSIVSSIFFFLYTNFGWWLVSGMYEYSLPGLLKSYIMAIPFFRNNLIGNLIFVPIAIITAEKFLASLKATNLSKHSLKVN